MHIQTFETTEEMVVALRKRAEEARAGLHSVQSSLTWGDHWVQFVDLENRHVVFGRIHFDREVGLAELLSGADWDDTVAVVEKTAASLDEGFMYGRAHDKFNVEGELGTTHKASVWPIEERLFLMAQRVDWNIAALDETGRFLLDLAYRQNRAHALGAEA